MPGPCSLSTLDSKLDAVLVRFDGVDARFDTVDDKLDVANGRQRVDHDDITTLKGEVKTQKEALERSMNVRVVLNAGFTSIIAGILLLAERLKNP